MAEEEKMMMNMIMMVMMVSILQLVLQPAEPEPVEPEPGVGQVIIGLRNFPAGATKWQIRVVDWDITQTISWGTTEQDNIGESAVFDIPTGWSFPLRISIDIYQKINGSQQLYTVQSYKPYLWDWDLGDWGTEPDPTYKEIFIPALGSYKYNVSTEEFEVQA